MIELRAQGSHDVIQVLASPYFDLFNPIGSLASGTNCDTDCPLTKIAVEAQMTTPDSVCEADRMTCGTWYQVEYPSRTDSTSTLGWISDQDEDVWLKGDCDALPTLNPDEFFTG